MTIRIFPGRLFLWGLASLCWAALLLSFPTESLGVTAGRTVDGEPQGTQYASGELLITYEAGVPRRAANRASRSADTRVLEDLPEVDARLLTFPEIKNERARDARERALERKRRALERNPVIESANYNYLRKPAYEPDDPGLDRQYGLKKIEAPQAWENMRGSGVKVGVVDTGVDAYHPDLRSKIAAQKDFVNGDATAEDNDGHGTHVAGVAAAATYNGEGVAGACPDCELLVAKSLGEYGGYDSDVADGIVWSVDNGAEVVNLSLGGEGNSEVLKDAVDYAWDNGSVVAAAAGNNGDSSLTYPAAYQNAIAVSATNREDEPASFSNYGDWIDVSAPGVDIVSTLPGEYGYISGTSQASPYVAALAGLLVGEGLSAPEARKLVESSATDLGEAGKDPYYGNGRIHAASDVIKSSTAPEKSAPALYRRGDWLLKDTLGKGTPDTTFRYGNRRGDEPMMGDWDGDGTKTPGIKRGNTFYLKNENQPGGGADIAFRFGNKRGDEPVVGDWDGDGKDTVGLVRGNKWILTNENSGGADIAFRYGGRDDEPVVGDWDANGADSAGVVRANAWYLTNENSSGSDLGFRYGSRRGDKPVVGDWDGDGKDTVGVVRSGRWLLSNANSGGAELGFEYPSSSDEGATPLVWRRG